MAKPIQKSSVQFTHKDLIDLLNEVWSSQFIYLARRDLRQAADGFFVEAVKLTGPRDHLSSLAPHVPALEDALKQHRADVDEKKVSLGPPKQTPSSWYVTLKDQSARVLGLLRAPVRPNEAKMKATPAEPEQAPVGTMTEHAAHTEAGNETGVAASSSASATSLETSHTTAAPDGSTGLSPSLNAQDDAGASSTAPGANPSPCGQEDEPESERRPTEARPAPLDEAAKADNPNARAADVRPAGPGSSPHQRGNPEMSDWELPAKLAEAVGPAFPCEVLSPWLKQFVEQLADQTQIQIDAPAVWTLAALGAAAAKGVNVEVQRGDRHPTNLWAVAVMPSGGGKSPTLEYIRTPFDEKQVELRAAARDARARRETELRVTRHRLRTLEKQAANTEDVEEHEALLERCASMQASIFALERPALPTLTTGDPTQASVTQLMGENDGKILLLTDEGDQLFTRIGGGEGIEAMLQAHSGITIERTRGGRHEIRVPAPSLSLVMGIQPGPFARVMGTRVYHDKGFLARFLFIVLEARNGARKQERDGLDDSTRHDYRNRIRRLLELSSRYALTLTLAPEALSAFSRFAARVDRDLALGGLVELREWGNKLRSVAARLAGILHAGDHALDEAIPREISLETMQRALRIAEYFEAHAFVAYGDAIRSAEDEAAKKVWRWIADGRLTKFRHGEAVRALNGRLTAAEVAEALERLVDEGYLRVVSTPRATRGRPSKATYRVNPLLVKSTEETDKSQ